MKHKQPRKQIGRALVNFAVFFALVAFVLTCSLTLFVSLFAEQTGLLLTREDLGLAAKATFLNAVLLALIFAVIDAVRRHFTVERPVKRITDAAERMMAGDFDVRITPVPHFGSDDTFNEVIDCFNRMAEELSGVETLRTDFIANVSHEMKTPLAAIRNYGTLLQDPSLGEEQRLEYAGAITVCARRLADMMTNILKLNRLENQRIYPKGEEYDLGEQLCECLLGYEQVWEKRSIELETEIEENVRVRADAELLSLVWNNLLSNAFKFTEDGGRVRVTLHTEGQYALVRVEDSGCGMSPEVGAHIFEKFYQGDTSRATEGNGLGLALVKRVVDILEGEIDVRSERGVGSVFTVRIRRMA